MRQAIHRTLMAVAEVLRALLKTIMYTGLTLLGIPIAIFVAALLNRRGLRGATIYRTLFFIPVITMPVAVAMVWRWLYNGEYGLINHLLSLVGIDGPHWISDPATALYALVVVGIWSLLGYQVVIFLAGLQAISREYYEAAEMDGAGWFTQFRHITVPLLTPSIFFVSVITVIGSLQLFDLVYIMSGGGTSARANPAFSSTQTIVYLFYSKAFVTNDRGYAAAIVMALLVLIVAFTALQFRMQRRWVHYA
jgi:multiple sugar transport system permease protein